MPNTNNVRHIIRESWGMKMAQKIQVILIDDLDGGPADETVNFGLDGTSYEIDLSTENVEKLREALAPWVGHARRLGRTQLRSRRARTGSASAPASGPSANTIREWARANGYTVSERGRIAADVREAYEAAH